MSACTVCSGELVWCSHGGFPAASTSKMAYEMLAGAEVVARRETRVVAVLRGCRRFREWCDNGELPTALVQKTSEKMVAQVARR